MIADEWVSLHQILVRVMCCDTTVQRVVLAQASDWSEVNLIR